MKRRKGENDDEGMKIWESIKKQNLNIGTSMTYDIDKFFCL